MRGASVAQAVIAGCLGATSLVVEAVTCSRADLAPSNPDLIYRDHGDGTVTDLRSRLMWKRCAEGQSWRDNACGGTASVFDWGAALAQARESTFAGHRDWRVPNIKELRALVEECRFDPAINDTVFVGTASGGFWSSSPYAGAPNTAWYVYFYDGFSKDFFRSFGFHVRLVRDAQP